MSLRQGSLHESYDRDHGVEAGSERSFGMVGAAVFAFAGLLPLLRRAPAAPRLWALAVSVVFLLLGLLWTAPLKPLNRLWLKVGLAVHLMASTVAMAMMFFGVITPIGLVLRALGKSALRRPRDVFATSHWILRHPPGPPPETMRKQF